MISPFRKVTRTPITVDMSNDSISDVVLNAGDINGRVIVVKLSNGGVPLPTGLTVNLMYNANPLTDLGDYVPMTKNSDGTFSAAIPPDAYVAFNNNSKDYILLGIAVNDASGNRVCTRNFTGWVEDSVINSKSPDAGATLGEILAAVKNANSATTSANSAASAANTATNSAKTATTAANSAASSATSATTAANTATSNANSATSSANTAATNATNASKSANSAASAANTATSAAKTATSSANTATTNANNAATSANTAAKSADTAAASANSAATLATNAAAKIPFMRNPPFIKPIITQNITHEPELASDCFVTYGAGFAAINLHCKWTAKYYGSYFNVANIPAPGYKLDPSIPDWTMPILVSVNGAAFAFSNNYYVEHKSGEKILIIHSVPEEPAEIKSLGPIILPIIVE